MAYFSEKFRIEGRKILLVLIYLLLAEKHTVKGEQAGGAVAQDKLCRNIHPARKPRIIHTHIQRPIGHIKKRICGNVGAVLRGGAIEITRYKLHINNS